MAKAGNIVDAINTKPTTEDHLKFMEEVYMIGLPLPLVQKLSDAAKARNLTLAELLGQSIDHYLRSTEPQTESTKPSGRRLLTEG